MLRTPTGFDRASTPSTVGASQSSNVRDTFMTMVNPSVPQYMGAQPVIGTWSLFSSNLHFHNQHHLREPFLCGSCLI